VRASARRQFARASARRRTHGDVQQRAEHAAHADGEREDEERRPDFAGVVAAVAFAPQLAVQVVDARIQFPGQLVERVARNRRRRRRGAGDHPAGELLDLPVDATQAAQRNLGRRGRASAQFLDAGGELRGMRGVCDCCCGFRIVRRESRGREVSAQLGFQRGSEIEVMALLECRDGAAVRQVVARVARGGTDRGADQQRREQAESETVS
jgi:hypothetical protein